MNVYAEYVAAREGKVFFAKMLFLLLMGKCRSKKCTELRCRHYIDLGVSFCCCWGVCLFFCV